MLPATTWTSDSLASELGARGDDVARLARHLETATDLLEDATRVTFRTIPESVADEMVLRVIRALWDGRKSAHGQQFTDNAGEAAPRAPRDPLASCEALLGRYVVPM